MVLSAITGGFAYLWQSNAGTSKYTNQTENHSALLTSLQTKVEAHHEKIHDLHVAFAAINAHVESIPKMLTEMQKISKSMAYIRGKWDKMEENEDSDQ